MESAEARSPICGAACHGAHPTPADHAIHPRSPRRWPRHWRGILGQAHHGEQPVEGLRHLIHLTVRPRDFSISSAPFSNESNSSSVISIASVVAAGEASTTRRSSWCVFHRSNSSAARRSWPRSSATSETTQGSMRGHHPVGFLAFVAPAQRPIGTAGNGDHVGASLHPRQ
jgi:hypothetical protein